MIPNNKLLTLSQYNIWVDQQLNPESSLYNIGGQVHIKGKIEPTIFSDAVNYLLERNDMLRGCFESDTHGNPYQLFQKYNKYELDFLDYSQEESPLDNSNKYMNEEFSKTFKLNCSRLYQFSLIKISEDYFIFFCKFHHLIMDGWGVSLVIEQIREEYNSISSNGEATDRITYSYIDYIEDDISYLESARYKKSEEYWKEKFKVKPQSILSSPMFKSPVKSVGSSNRKSIYIDRKNYNSIINLGKQQKTSVANVLLAFVFIYFNKITSLKEITLGLPLLNRSSKKFKKTIGLFAETSPLVIDFSNIYTVKDLIFKVTVALGECYRHQRFPVTEIKKMSNSNSLNRLFDVVFSYEKHTYDKKFMEYNTSGISMHCNSQNNALTIHVEECDEEEDVVIHFDYRCDIFENFSIDNFTDQFTVLYKNIIREPDSLIKDLQIVNDYDIQQLLYSFNDTKKHSPEDDSIVSMFEEQVKKTPNNIALIYEGLKLTYKELNEKSNKVGHYLREEYNIKANDIVGIQLSRSQNIIIILLGILKSGAAYVPIDPDYPDERIKYIIEDSEPKVVINKDNFTSFLDNECSIENPQCVVTGKSLFYVIYTSGTTGLPKGTLITNSNYIHYLNWAIDYYFKDSDKGNFPLFTSLSFDLTTTSIYLALCRGKSLTVFNQESNLTDILSEIFNGGVIDSVKLTPSHISLLLNMELVSKNIALAIVGGEELLNQQVGVLKSINPDMRIINEYGPTEATVGCIVKEIDNENEKILIGKPIYNTEVYILDSDCNLLPVGVPGEIFIGGKGVALGYLGRSDLTQSKFIENPFFTGDVIYRTGDLGRWLEDGDIEYLGRIDDQVKVRGHRVELGEIENNLLKIPGIQFAVLSINSKNAGDKFLAAYYISDINYEISEIRNHLSKLLPEYMIPSYFVPLESVPLTSNGKVDRKNLPDPVKNSISTSVEYSAPRNDIEKMLIDIWGSIIGVKNSIGIDDNFFEIGGDSIKAIQIMSRLKQKGINGEVSLLFDNPTIRSFVKTLNSNVKVIDQSPVSGDIQLTPIQKWFFNDVDCPKHHYNQSVLLEIKQAVDFKFINNLKESTTFLLKHHDALRMKFIPCDNPIQENRDVNDVKLFLKEFDLKNESNPWEKLEDISNEVQDSFNLEEDILIRFVIFYLPEGTYLLIVSHHLIIDGYSWRILVKDLELGIKQLYNGDSLELPLKTTSYKEWSREINKYGSSRKLRDEIHYWRTQNKNIGSYLPESSLEKRIKSKSIYTFDREKTDDLLTKTNSAFNTSINDILLVSLVRGLRNLYSEDNSISIDLESHGRSKILKDIDLSRTIGWFTSIYPVVFDIRDCEDIEEEIITVRETLEEVPVNGVGYGVLKYLTDNSSINSNSEVLFNYLGQFDSELNGDIFKLTLNSAGDTVSKKALSSYKLTINCLVSDNKFIIIIESDYYNKEYLDHILSIFSKEITALINYTTNKTSLINDLKVTNERNLNKAQRIRI